MLVSTVCMRSETSAVESKSTIGLSITRLQASLIPAFFFCEIWRVLCEIVGKHGVWSLLQPALVGIF